MGKDCTSNKKNPSKKNSQKNHVFTFVKVMIVIAFFLFEIFLYNGYSRREEEIYHKQNNFNNEIGEKFSSSIRKKDFFNDMEYINEYYAKYEENLKLTTVVSQNKISTGERNE
ncbi:hypothetical protein [Fusobacterium sp. PH5-44]|uniref:hypothetical protein n=1 Tax=unclassified Fusobacterium TaxID=2648384 RepID=UPI003D1E74F6